MPQIDRNLIKRIEAHKDIIKEKFSVESMESLVSPESPKYGVPGISEFPGISIL